jgi:hypothetical protein
VGGFVEEDVAKTTRSREKPRGNGHEDSHRESSANAGKGDSNRRPEQTFGVEISRGRHHLLRAREESRCSCGRGNIPRENHASCCSPGDKDVEESVAV